MEQQVKQDFTRRLSQCNSGEMIVLIYDICFAYLDDAQKAHESGDRAAQKEALRRAQRVLDTLIQGLDFSYDIAQNLCAIYRFCKRELSRAMYENRMDGVHEAQKLLRRLYRSFVSAAQQDKSAPLMKNTQQVYTGMTYARGALQEDYLDDDVHRGFFV